ncbi:hypothetical protein AB0B10_25215 [Micromonospora arborensis]|uniref:hypothetical protein n=1 Tax=Micromonospora arborensis TaxID=2116518 RepID=UPI0034117C80
MTIDVQLVRHYNRTVLPGNNHTYNGRRIVGADMFRVDMTLIVPAAPDEVRAQFEKSLLPEHVKPGEPYGLILMSSQLFDCMYLTTPTLVEAYRDKPIQLPQGIVYGGWPNAHGGPMEGLLPETTWFPNGVGILDEIEGIDGAKVAIYEYTVDKAQTYNHRAEPVGELANMVTYHCDRCHRPAPFDLREKIENRGPNERYIAALDARNHARGTDGHCTVPDGKMEQVVSRVASEMHGCTIELPAPASTCAAEEGCAQVREARAATMLLARA